MSKDLPACPVEVTLMLISDRWKVLVLRDLLSDPEVHASACQTPGL